MPLCMHARWAVHQLSCNPIVLLPFSRWEKEGSEKLKSESVTPDWFLLADLGEDGPCLEAIGAKSRMGCILSAFLVKALEKGAICLGVGVTTYSFGTRSWPCHCHFLAPVVCYFFLIFIFLLLVIFASVSSPLLATMDLGVSEVGLQSHYLASGSKSSLCSGVVFKPSNIQGVKAMVYIFCKHCQHPHMDPEGSLCHFTCLGKALPFAVSLRHWGPWHAHVNNIHSLRSFLVPYVWHSFGKRERRGSKQ